MVWEVGSDPVDAVYLGTTPVAGAVTTRNFAGPEGFYSWWTFPNPATHPDGDRTLMGVMQDTTQLLVEIDHTDFSYTTFELNTAAYDEDDHSPSAQIWLDDETTLIVAYTGHNEDHILRYRISTTGYIADLGSEHQLTMANTNRKTTYVQPIAYGSEVLLFTRIATENWYVLRSTNSAASFAAEQAVIDTDRQFYAIFRNIPERKLIRCVCYPHPQYENNQIRIFDIDMGLLPGLCIASGAPKGYLSGAAYNGAVLPFLETQMPSIWTPGTGNMVRLQSVRDDGEAILVARGTYPDGADATYWIGRLTAGADPHLAASWIWSELRAAGLPFYARMYVAGVEFAREPHGGERLYIAYRLSGGTYVLEMWNSQDGENWVKIPVYRSATEKVLRPFTPANSTGRLSCIYGKGQWTGFDNYEMFLQGLSVAQRTIPVTKLRWEIRALPDVLEGGTAKFLLAWYAAPIPVGTTCTIDIVESGTASGADFSATLDAAIAASISGLTGVSYDSTNNRLSLTHEAVSPIIVSRATASGDGADDLETWTLTISNASHGTISAPSATTKLVDPAGAPLNGLSAGASAAWGFDRLFSLYAGPAIRLRRGSDDVESDFGFDGSGLLDTSAITTWLNGATGYGRTWYDQTGNANPGEQTTKANQPQLVLNATPNGRPVWRFNGTTQCFVVAASAGINNIFAGGGYCCWGFRAASAGGGSLGRVWFKAAVSDGTTNSHFLRWFDATHVRFTQLFSNASNRHWHSVVPSNGASAWTVYGMEYSRDATANLPVTRVNSATSGANSAAPTGGTANTDGASALVIGNTTAGTSGWHGDIFAGCWFQTAPGLTDEEKVEDAIMAQYGVAA